MLCIIAEIAATTTTTTAVQSMYNILCQSLSYGVLLLYIYYSRASLRGEARRGLFFRPSVYFFCTAIYFMLTGSHAHICIYGTKYPVYWYEIHSKVRRTLGRVYLCSTFHLCSSVFRNTPGQREYTIPSFAAAPLRLSYIRIV